MSRRARVELLRPAGGREIEAVRIRLDDARTEAAAEVWADHDLDESGTRLGEGLPGRLVAGDRSLFLIDVRTPAEYAAPHIAGAVNVALPDSGAFIEPCSAWTVVLYSTGMTHPAQARDTLARLGRPNVLTLTEGGRGR